MRRISHDLAGVTQRIAKLRDDFAFAVSEVESVWKDEMGRSFLQQHTADVSPTVSQLVSKLLQTNELFESIAKQVRDEDNHD